MPYFSDRLTDILSQQIYECLAPLLRLPPPLTGLVVTYLIAPPTPWALSSPEPSVPISLSDLVGDGESSGGALGWMRRRFGGTTRPAPEHKWLSLLASPERRRCLEKLVVSGVPDSLRGIVWPVLVGIRDPQTLRAMDRQAEYDSVVKHRVLDGNSPPDLLHRAVCVDRDLFRGSQFGPLGCFFVEDQPPGEQESDQKETLPSSPVSTTPIATLRRVLRGTNYVGGMMSPARMLLLYVREEDCYCMLHKMTWMSGDIVTAWISEVTRLVPDIAWPIMLAREFALVFDFLNPSDQARIFDCLFFFGPTFLIRFAVVVVREARTQGFDVLAHMRVDIDKLIKCACKQRLAASFTTGWSAEIHADGLE